LKEEKVMKKLWAISACILLSLFVTACNGNKEEEVVAGFGDTIEFDQLEITFGREIEWDVIDNQFSELDGKDVFRIPVTVKNVSDQTHGLDFIYYKKFGPNGNELSTSASAYFEDAIDYAGNSLSGAQIDGSFMIFLYEGDGLYTVEFDKGEEKIIAEFNITK
jgi:hypothetical protein